ncbi:MAG: T9SS type A sorting domain-containing protein, partial [Candidatus Marinimicrobia bacterium]|nr:T9SS type A sorting domain-containing protein [Candidatus Neomarinimicrobiota bacterium]
LKPSSVSQYGGGLYAVNSDIRLHNTLIDHNFAKNKGGGIALRSSKIFFVQSTLADNNSSTDSSAIFYINETSEPSLILNSILWNSGEFELELENTDIEITNSVLGGALMEILLSGNENDIQLLNVIDSDPLLDVNHSLSFGSPAIDQGVVSYELGDNYLINYTPSQYSGTAPDLGYNGASPEIYFDLELIETSIFDHPESYSLLRAFPNPFNPSTTLEFTLEQFGDTEISIYNIRGQLMQTLLQRELLPGTYSFTYNAAHLSTGMYICQLKQDGLPLSTQKLVLVK